MAVAFTLAAIPAMIFFQTYDLTRLMMYIGTITGLGLFAFFGRWLWNSFGMLEKGMTIKTGPGEYIISFIIAGVIPSGVVLIILAFVTIIPFAGALTFPAFVTGFAFIPWYSIRSDPAVGAKNRMYSDVRQKDSFIRCGKVFRKCRSLKLSGDGWAGARTQAHGHADAPFSLMIVYPICPGGMVRRPRYRLVGEIPNRLLLWAICYSLFFGFGFGSILNGTHLSLLLMGILAASLIFALNAGRLWRRFEDVLTLGNYEETQWEKMLMLYLMIAGFLLFFGLQGLVLSRIHSIY